MEDRIIGYRDDAYDPLSKRESALREAHETLVTKTEAIQGKEGIDDYLLLIEDPVKYNIDKFFENYGSNEPPHTNRERFLRSKVDANLLELGKIKSTINDLTKRMMKYAPTIAKDGITYNLESMKKDFDLILDPAKEDEYNALQKLLAAALELKENHAEYSTMCRAVDIVSYHPGLRWEMSKNQVYIDARRYAKK
ncbi:hypothetical protein [Maribacter sp. 2307UL18-2]|uniref:hypothetical protein n=1 Tax=Maribacter sp. 2307UL18-2 TaxID=3386274 RepID=UPI0039BC849B